MINFELEKRIKLFEEIASSIFDNVTIIKDYIITGNFCDLDNDPIIIKVSTNDRNKGHVIILHNKRYYGESLRIAREYERKVGLIDCVSLG